MMRTAVLIRAFASKPEFVEKTLEAVVRTIDRLFELQQANQVHMVYVLVPSDGRYGDSDCGEIAKAINRMNYHRVLVVETLSDVFCGTLNLGIAEALSVGSTHGLIVSSGVSDYITNENMGAIREAHAGGALVTGLAIAELRDSIMAGRIANTFASWDLKKLVMVGGFDLRAAKPRKDDKLVHYMQGKAEGDKEVYYHLAGVEEIIPLIRLTRQCGRCIAPIVPGGDAEWKLPTDPEGLERHIKKIGTKFARQATFAALEGAELALLEDGVMGGYPRVL
ncbi:MAG: hypothetical protein AAB725_02585 [Patescibacteria group bacterium]